MASVFTLPIPGLTLTVGRVFKKPNWLKEVIWVADEDLKSMQELLKQLGERMNALVKLNGDAMRILAERAALAARMHTEAMAEFARNLTLSQRLFERISERIQARRTTA